MFELGYSLPTSDSLLASNTEDDGPIAKAVNSKRGNPKNTAEDDDSPPPPLVSTSADEDSDDHIPDLVDSSDSDSNSRCSV